MPGETDFSGMPVGEIIRTDFRAIQVFRAAGIDFCNGANKSVQHACRQQGLDPSALIGQLTELRQTEIPASMDFNSWDAVMLVDYIENVHHAFVIKSLPELGLYTRKIAIIHGHKHQELTDIARYFEAIIHELVPHVEQEEDVLFPAIRRAAKDVDPRDRDTILSVVHKLRNDHELAVEVISIIRGLSNNYTVPENCSNSYKMTYDLLRHFEDDMMVHLYLENNLLFPKALEMCN